ncbi:DUF1700 domain-containing protein [Schleiferilactobacillus harbinensis]|uniref:DUF1700 domain-containing protein n=1 Tax=Schleiferilactobacillus harbinensis TaxID=304207 RepID=A0A5P8M4W2_9LACO|nr:DUF1700 domain-containing protein [Schleiferilactobacillus harbinensis]MBO3092005.1 DUF1700 domain-containing protein [Schleiferilactobacillus harbinensis]QFR23548.1 DUF1700 domain-containing protein [Schleiferilactobacillus harbinensis]
MTIADYFAELTRLLAPLTADERTEAIEYFQDYVADAQFSDGAAVTAELGSPRQLALKILADYSIKSSAATSADGEKVSPRANARQIWTIILAILSAPMAIPVAIMIFALMLALLLIVSALSAALLIVLAGLCLTGLFVSGFALWSGIWLVFSDPMIGISYLGLGLAAGGAGVILIPVLKWAAQGLASVWAAFFRWLYRKVRRQRQEAI